MEELKKKIDLKSKSACIFGLPDSGKSTLACYIASSFGPAAFVFDTLNEFPSQPFDSYVPKDRGDAAELSKVIRQVMAGRKYRLIMIDETNRYCPSKPAPLPQAIADLNDFRAHYELGTVYIARRPVQLNQDLTELAHYLFLFKLPGRNDRDFLNGQMDGLGDKVANLAQYHFIVLYPNRHYEEFKPVSAKFKTSKIISSHVSDKVTSR